MKYLVRIFFFFLPLWGPGGLVSGQELKDYLQIAAQNNPEVKAAYAEFEASMQKLPQVSSLPDPTLSVSPFGMMETKMGPQKATFELMQMFPWFGTLKARKSEAALLAEAKFQEYLDVRNRLLYEVSAKYYELFSLEEKIDFQEDNLRILEDFKELSLAKVSAGSGLLTDVLKVELLQDEMLSAIKILELERKPLLAEFNALLNRESNSEVEIPEELEMPSENIIPSKNGISEEHPRIQIFKKRESAARAGKLIAQKNGLPQIGVGIEYMVIGQPDMNMENAGKDAIMPMFQVTLPIFRKKYKAAEKEAEFMQESFAQRKIATVNSLETEYENALFGLERIKEQLELYQRQVKSTGEILNLSLSYYQNAKLSFEEVLRLQQEFLRLNLAEAEAKSEYFTLLAKIDYLVN
ncbi:MAG TPA: TolC family protein [Salinimicrobium sp.]|nr:TolC family protein [Salinimicrobium sp.]